MERGDNVVVVVLSLVRVSGRGISSFGANKSDGRIEEDEMEEEEEYKLH